jgi:hypothetical protein
MSRADDLLQLAEDLSHLKAPNRRQVDLSRAVSSAYYALFHLLISDATANWSEESLRPVFPRMNCCHGFDSHEDARMCGESMLQAVCSGAEYAEL